MSNNKNAVMKLANRKVIASLATIAALSGGVSMASFAVADTPNNNVSTRGTVSSNENLAQSKYGASVKGVALNTSAGTQLNATPLVNGGEFAPGTDHYELTIDLGRVSDVSSAKIHVTNQTVFKFSYSEDGNAWSTPGSVTTNASGEAKADGITSPIRARFVRFTATSVTGSTAVANYKLSNLEVIGSIDLASTLDVKTLSADGNTLKGLPSNVEGVPGATSAIPGFDLTETGKAYYHANDTQDVYVKTDGVGTVSAVSSSPSWTVSAGEAVTSGPANGYTKYTIKSTPVRGATADNQFGTVKFTSSTNAAVTSTVAMHAYAKSTGVKLAADSPVASVSEKNFKLHATVGTGTNGSDVKDENGLTPVNRVRFSTDDASSATVTASGESIADVKFLKEGRVKFTAKAADDPTVVGERTVVIKKAGDVTAEYKIDGLPESRVLKPGADAQLKLVDQAGNPYDGDVTWTSSDAAVAKVDATGKVTGVAESTNPVTITAKTDDGREFKAQLTVSNKTTKPSSRYSIEDLKNLTANYEADGATVKGFNYKTSAVETSGPKTAVKIKDGSKVKLQGLPESVVRSGGWLPGATELKDASGKVIGQKFAVTAPDDTVVATYQFVYESAYSDFTGENDKTVDPALANVKIYVDGTPIDGFKYDSLEYALKAKPKTVQVTGVPDGWAVANATKGSSDTTHSNPVNPNKAELTAEDMSKVKSIIGNEKPSYYTDSTDVNTPTSISNFNLDTKEYTSINATPVQLEHINFYNSTVKSNLESAGYSVGAATYDKDGKKLFGNVQDTVYKVLTIHTGMGDQARGTSYVFTSKPDLGPLAGGKDSGSSSASNVWTVDSKTFGNTETKVTIDPVTRDANGKSVTYSLKYGAGSNNGVTANKVAAKTNDGAKNDDPGRDLAKTGIASGAIAIFMTAAAGAGAALRKFRGRND